MIGPVIDWDIQLCKDGEWCQMRHAEFELISKVDEHIQLQLRGVPDDSAFFNRVDGYSAYVEIYINPIGLKLEGIIRNIRRLPTIAWSRPSRTFSGPYIDRGLFLLEIEYAVFAIHNIEIVAKIKELEAKVKDCERKMEYYLKTGTMKILDEEEWIL